MGRSNKNTLKKTLSKASYMAGSVDGLPEGWKVEIKIRESGNHAGNKYKCYIAPGTGHKCYSKEEVFRYLISKSKQDRSTVSEAHIQGSSVTKTHVGAEQKDALDEFPPGWTMDIKVRKSGTKLRADPYYTDPHTGYVFRSKKDALRYVKTGELGKYAFKPKERRTNNVKEEGVTTSGHQSTGKCSNSDELVNDEPVFVDQCSKSDEAVNDEPKLDAEVSKPGEAVNGESAVESSAIGGGDMELSRPFPLKHKSSKKRKGKKATFAKVESQSVENGVEEHKRRQTGFGSKKRKKLELDSPRRVSKRLAGIAAEVVAVMERPSRTPQADAVGQPPEAMLVVNSTGPDAKLASEMDRLDVTPPVEAAKQLPEAKLAVNSTGTNGELASDLEGSDTTRATSVEPPSGTNLAVNSTGTNCEVASDLEGPDTTQAAWVGPPSGAKPTVSFTSVDSACLVSAQFNQLGLEKAGNGPADPLTGEIHLKQEGSQVITKEVTATTWASGGEEYLEQGTSDIRREEETIQSQPLLDHVTPGELDIKTQADGNLEDALELPFREWADPCLEFAYKTLTGDIPVDGGEVSTISNTIPMSDPCIEFAYNTLTGTIPAGDNPSKAWPDVIPITGAIPVGDSPSTTCPDAIPMSDPCIEFAYKTLTGAIPVENTPPVTFTNAIPTSDPCVEFAYRTLTGVPMETPARVENNQTVPVPVPGAIPLSDPCLEFAYKTLIGAIPVESLAAHGYLQQQCSAQTRNDNLVDGCFGSVVKPTSLNNLQNDSVGASPNESLQFFSNNGVQHPNHQGEMDRR